MAAASRPQLRKALVDIYRDRRSLQRLLDDAEVSHAVGEGLIKDEWNEALRQAQLQSRLKELVQTAVDEYPGNDNLRASAAELGVSPIAAAQPPRAVQPPPAAPPPDLAAELGVSPIAAAKPLPAAPEPDLAAIAATLRAELVLAAPAADWSYERASSRQTRARRLLEDVQRKLAAMEVDDSSPVPSIDRVRARDALESAKLSVRRMSQVLELLANPRITGERRAECSADYTDRAAEVQARLSALVALAGE